MNKPRLARRRAIAPTESPTAQAIEHERSLWGPNPDPAMTAMEDLYFAPGFKFLADLYGAAMGLQAPRDLRKALDGGRADWGELAALFQRDRSPEELRTGWAAIIDRLVNRLLPQQSKQDLANAVALKAHWLGRVRARVAERALEPGSYQEALAKAGPIESRAMEWTRVRALEHATNLESWAKEGLMQTLIETRQAGLGVKELQRKCFDRFSDLNRDWRRIALTESAAAVSNGQLAAVDPEEGWEAVWISAPTGCRWCKAFNGRVFKLVSPDAPNKDGDTQVWVGKSNAGRSGNFKDKTGRVRSKAELWWPCVPCHPNCACQYVLRRIVLRAPIGRAA